MIVAADMIAFAGHGSVSPPRIGPAVLDVAPVGPLERLIQLTRSNDRLLGELAVAKRRLRQARDYQGDPTSRVVLGNALVAHARRHQARILDQLGRNRSEAIRLLAGGSNGR